MELKIKKLDPKAITPTYGTEGAACFDISSIDSGVMTPHSALNFKTGLSFEVPEGHVMLVFSRSGTGFKHNTRLANCVGVIDSDYRGELMVKLTGDANANLHVAAGDRIAQAMVIPVKQVTFLEVDELSSTERGTGGLGSTGVAAK